MHTILLYRDPPGVHERGDIEVIEIESCFHGVLLVLGIVGISRVLVIAEQNVR